METAACCTVGWQLAITDDMVSLTKALFHSTIFTRPQTTLQLAWAALG